MGKTILRQDDLNMFLFETTQVKGSKVPGSGVKNKKQVSSSSCFQINGFKITAKLFWAKPLKPT
ncbi:hypothetical protein JW964_17985 [candidate division KSB1 bacterium]|nr:hypothetical protein [candidate division KSB1 bacterium]